MKTLCESGNFLFFPAGTNVQMTYNKIVNDQYELDES